FDAWVADLEAVVEATGAERFPLLGISQGAPVAVKYAVLHPERVSHLVLYGAYARGRLKRGGSAEEFQAKVALTRLGWGRDNPAYRQMFTTEFMPDASAEQMQWFNELQRISTSPENAARIQAEASQIDVLDLLPKVSVPTLVLHAKDDVRVPFEQGRQVSALIPNSRLVAVDSNNHLLMENEPAWRVVISEIRSFLGDPEEAATPRQPGTTQNDQLSQRELEVLRLIADGNSNPQIARALFISVKTVGNHVSNILGKTNATNRSEAVAQALRSGLI
ncbi:MAG: alpha/beta fold hydrolase, partial [Dehalococcoidia bacterium]